MLDKEWVEKYINQGVEEFEAIIKSYDPDVLDRYSKEEIKAAKPIEKLFKDEHQTLDLTLLKAPYYETKDFEDKYEYEGGIWDSNKNILKGALEKKYNTEFLPMYSGFNAYKNNPELMFDGYFVDDVVVDHFQSMMYQHLLNQRIRKMVDESGLSDRVLFFVNAEPKVRTDDGISADNQPYDFGEGFDEDFFLEDGYNGYIDITFIYLDDEAVDVENTKWATVAMLEKKFFYPLHEEIEFGTGSYQGADGQWYSKGGVKDVYFISYHVDDYERKVAIDLFKKTPITERAAKPEARSMADAFSLQYKTRAETTGFHFLDIFGGKGRQYNCDY